MEPTQQQPQPQQRPPVRRHQASGIDGLKQSAMSLKDSSLGYMQAKTELAAIEAKEAATYAKQKISVGVITAFLGLFSYALFLLLAYGVIIQFAGEYIRKIFKPIYLNESNALILVMMVFHLFLFLIYLIKFSKKPKEELFSLTKSEFQKDKQWLAEINESQRNGN